MTITSTFSVPSYYRIKLNPSKDPVSDLRDVYFAINTLIQQQQIGNPQGTIVGVPASEAIAGGAAINLFNNSGVLTARNANSSNSARMCHGICVTLSGIASGAQGLVDLGVRAVGGYTGLTVGQNLWLAPSNGALQSTPDTASGHIEQYLGIVLNTSTILFKPTNWIQH